MQHRLPYLTPDYPKEFAPCLFRIGTCGLSVTSTTNSLKNRSGASLLEVLIATAILLVALATLGTQISVGLNAALRVQWQSLSTLICQSILDEQIASGNFLATEQPRPIEGFSGWFYTSKVEEILRDHGGREDLKSGDWGVLTVTTWKSGPSAARSRVHLSQWIRRRTDLRNQLGRESGILP